MQLWTRLVLTFVTTAATASRTRVNSASLRESLPTNYSGKNLLENKRFEAAQTCGRRFAQRENIRDLQRKATKAPQKPERGLHVLTKRIVGGNVSHNGAWPWEVALFLDGSQVCAGSLVNPNWIVSACHCFTDYRSSTDPRRWRVKLGGVQTESETKGFEQVREVKRVFLHPLYREKTQHGVLVQPPDFDVALLELSSSAAYDGNVFPICLANDGIVFPPGKTCYVTGWGSTGWNKPASKVLRQAALRLVPRDECNKEESYNGTVPRTALCAGFKGGKVDACQKDSGGPLACEDKGRWYLVGVVSWGRHCALPNKYGVYADVRVSHTWIKNVIKHGKSTMKDV